VLVVLGVGAGVAAWWGSDTVLACRGTVALIQGGQQTNPKDEPKSLVVVLNLYRQTVKVDDGSEWPLRYASTVKMTARPVADAFLNKSRTP
jgi:hypothetical protein